MKNKKTTVEQNIGKNIVCPQCGYNKALVEKSPTSELTGDLQIEQYFCPHCGYTSCSVFDTDSVYLKRALQTMPDIIRDYKFYDETREIWWFLAAMETNNGWLYPMQYEGDETYFWEYMPMKIVSKYTPDEISKLVLDDEKLQHAELYSFEGDKENIQVFKKEDFNKAIKLLDIPLFKDNELK